MKQVKIVVWGFFSIVMIILMFSILLDIIPEFYSGSYDLEKLKTFIILLDLVFLGIVAIIEKGKFPVRYLILLGIISSVFNFILVENNYQNIIFSFLYLILYYGIKIIERKYDIDR